ncbi:uncharacterized protein LOC105431434 isoform X1 [Pogonomyrmex barbatus]|uniref:Uncharacterized protein LOC105431434 isoform X1 n=2 Tax=Pogonomyrmex barbatus TaxID=144034 RepID=A0A6I9WLX2_9HYME|nr:uncharacterized protein LOC105431434 isoform X1 [Pogonomyrmex barbatus]
MQKRQMFHSVSKRAFMMCMSDNDCIPNISYCYEVSKFCVNYINCRNYNRLNGTAPARIAAQCGACLQGYITETYTTGEEKELCYKENTDVTENYIGLSVHTFIIVPVTFLFVVIILCCIYALYYNKSTCPITKSIKYIFSNICSIDCLKADLMRNNTENINTLTVATAPIEEQKPFLENVENIHHRADISKEADRHQTARVCVPPIWARENGTDQIYLDNNNVNVPNERNFVTQLQIINNVATNDQFMRQLPIIGYSENNTEQQDNTRNTAMLQASSANQNSNTDSSPEPNDNNNCNCNHKTVKIRQLLQQNIGMNVNV